MSYRPPYSYWLTVSIPDNMSNMPGLLDTVADQVKYITDQDISQVDASDMPTSFSMQVDDDLGTVEEIADIENKMLWVSGKNPLLTFDLTCLNEEDKSAQTIYRFYNGKTFFERHARLIEADNDELQALAALTLTRDRAVYLLNKLFQEINETSKDPAKDSLQLISGILSAAIPKAPEAQQDDISIEDCL